MQVIKFDDQKEAYLKDRLLQWILQSGGDPTKVDDIIQYLHDDRFSVSAYVCDETIVDTLFRVFDEDFYGEYSKSIIDHIPQKLLLAVHEWVDPLSGVTEDRLIDAIKVVVCEDFNEEIFQYAYQCAEENEEDRPTPDAIAENIDHYALQWLESIVRDAIAEYNSPITVSIPSLSNYTE